MHEQNYGLPEVQSGWNEDLDYYQGASQDQGLEDTPAYNAEGDGAAATQEKYPDQRAEQPDPVYCNHIILGTNAASPAAVNKATCRYCNTAFPSKNKLHHHLRSQTCQKTAAS